MSVKYGYILNEDGTTTPQADPGAVQRGEVVALAADSEKLGGRLPDEYFLTEDASNLGGVQMELVWENASPASSFSAQTIEIDFSEGTHALIEYRVLASNENFIMCTISKVGNQTELIRITATDENTKYLLMTRYATVNSNNISFGDAWYAMASSGPAVDNEYCVPVRIYKIKGASA